jgi:lipoprotein
MKKFLLCAAVIMLLGFSSCSSGREEPPPDLGPVNSPEASAEATAGQLQSAPPSGAEESPSASQTGAQGGTAGQTLPTGATPSPTSSSEPGRTPVPAARIGEAKEHYNNIRGVNGKVYQSLALHADNYIYFCGGEYDNQYAPPGTYRLDVATDELEYFSAERMSPLFIAGQWLYYKQYDAQSRKTYSCRMHSDGTAQTRLSYDIPAGCCYLNDYIYYPENGVIYKRLISGGDQIAAAFKPADGEEFLSVCTDGENLYIASETEGGESCVYKYGGSALRKLWTGEEIGGIIYDSGYLWSETYITDNESYILLRISAETGESDFEWLAERYSRPEFNIAGGKIYISENIYGYGNLRSMDINFENSADLSKITSAGNINGAWAGKVCVAGDYLIFTGSVGKGVYDNTILHKMDGSGKYMLIDTDFPEDQGQPMLGWQINTLLWE